MRTMFLFATALPLAACLGPAPPPPPMPYEVTGAADCAAASYPVDPRVAAAMLDKFIGVYRLGRQSVTVSRSGSRFTIHRVLFGIRDLKPDAPESWTFHDGCGVRYDFQLPPDGPGGMVTITDRDGTVSRWHR
jgi:hypothetical protein